MPHHYKPRGKDFFYLLVLVLLPWGAWAQGAAPLAPLTTSLRYDVSVVGIPVGRIRIAITESPTRYTLSIDTKSTGLVHLVSPVFSIVETEGARIPASAGAVTQYLPTRYHAFETRSDGSLKQETTLRFDAAGHIATRTREPDDDTAWRPPVPFEEVNTGSDPITAFFRLRAALHAQLQAEEAAPLSATPVTGRSYDGARLGAITLTPHAYVTQPLMDRPTPLLDTLISRALLHGYTPKEKKKFAAGDPEMHLYFTNDAAFLPARATVVLPIGQLEAVLSERVDE